MTVLHHGNAPRLPASGELAVLQSADVAYRGQIVAAVVADELETAQRAAGLVRVGYHALEHDVILRADHPGLYAPERVNPNFATDTAEGDVEAALAGAAVVVDRTYTTPAEHNNAMEPHATVAIWDGARLTLYDSTQGAWRAAQTLAEALGLDTDRVRVVSHHVGGGFGSKGTPRPHAVLAAICARRDRPAGQARGHPPPDVRADRLPDADDPAPPAGSGAGRHAWSVSRTTSPSRRRRCRSSRSRRPSSPG